jgi:hypothetical protein
MESGFKFVVEPRKWEAQITPGMSRLPKSFGKVIATRCMVSGQRHVQEASEKINMSGLSFVLVVTGKTRSQSN